jgi:uncharacterized repeat protein (TIGR03803 family)
MKRLRQTPNYFSKFRNVFMTLTLLMTASFLIAQIQPATSFTVLHTFEGSPNDGSNPAGALVRDLDGNLYGATHNGGATGYGAVFKVTNTRKETLLHSFSIETGDGFQPAAGLLRDANGNLFGTTEFGGATALDVGTVFEINSTGVENVLYSFSGGADGAEPLAGLIADAKGDLYGTTFGANETYPAGVVFKLAPSPPWTETVLHTFKGEPDGVGPEAGLIMDSNGTLYGTTSGGGRGEGYGTVFSVDKTGKEKVLYRFQGETDGGDPLGGLVLDSAGNLYGTTSASTGNAQGGVVFKLSLDPNGTWIETVLYAFCLVDGCADGYAPEAGLVRDTQGNLYGTTSAGGTGGFAGREGVVFKLTPTVTAPWTETVLYSFTDTTDGANPTAPLIMDAQGNLYGTTTVGGDLTACGGTGCGTVFKITP